MRVRNVVPWLLILLVLGPLALFAWMTVDPDAAWIERAESWPVVGPLAERFRRTYVPPPPAEVPEAEVEIVHVPPQAQRPDLPPADAQIIEPVWLEPGLRLYAEPTEASRQLAVVERYRSVVPRAVRDDWYRVEERGRLGWVRIEPRIATDGEPLLGSAPAPVLPVRARAPDAEELERARALLVGETTGRLGPYDIYTDVRNATLIHQLDRAADALEDVYRSRFGVEPVGEPAGAVVLFDRESAYRTYQSGDARLEGLPAAGHAGSGLVALFADRQETEQVTAILIHELVHLLNRRALGPALPAWLDEGLAEDLTWSRTDDFGRPIPGTWGGVELQNETRILRLGGAAVRDRYRRAAASDRLIPLDELFRMEWREFVLQPDGLAYAQAGLWVRWLLDEGPKAPFQKFLRDTARGERITEERLLETLGLSWEEMAAAVGAWVG